MINFYLQILVLIAATILTSCDSTPDGVIGKKDMAHVLADFAKAEMLIEQKPDLFPDDSSKMLLKQSILKKYDADLAMYDSSLVWYGHNLKVFSEVHDKAIEILEKENKNGSPVYTSTPGENLALNDQNSRIRRTFPTSGDSANVWKEPQQWILTNTLLNGHIKFDYTPDNDCRRGDKYTLCFKMANSGNAITMLMAIDYQDGCTSYISRTAQANGWIENALQADSSKVIKRIYGFIRYKTRPLGITFIDSTYMLRTHFDKGSYSIISQRIVGPKAVIESQNQEEIALRAVESGERRVERPITEPRTPNPEPAADPQPTGQGSYKPKPGLNKSSAPRRGLRPNPQRPLNSKH